MNTYELLTADGKTITWSGVDGVHAAARAADCIGVVVVAWRVPRVAFVVGVDPRDIIG